MRKTVLSLVLVVLLCFMVSAASAFTVCVWKDCPQPDALKGIAIAPDVEIFKNINFNGETDVVRIDKSWKPAIGIGTNLVNIKKIIDIDAKYVRIVNDTPSNLYGLGVSASLLDLADLTGWQRPAILKKFVMLKIGPQALTDASNKYKFQYGAYATIFQAAF